MICCFVGISLGDKGEVHVLLVFVDPFTVLKLRALFFLGTFCTQTHWKHKKMEKHNSLVFCGFLAQI